MNNNREFQKIGVKNSEQERFCPVQIKSQVKVVAAVEVAVGDGFHDVVLGYKYTIMWWDGIVSFID